jgi:fused signal recognition particle receptor
VSGPEAKKPGLMGRLFGRPLAAPDTPAEDQSPANAPSPQPAAAQPHSVASAALPSDERTAPGDNAATPVPADVPAEAQAEPPAAAKKGWFKRLSDGLTKTSTRLTTGITGLFTKRKLDDDMLEELEDLLVGADLGIETATRITGALRKGRFDKEIAPDEVRAVLAAEVQRVLEPVAKPLTIDPARKPHVVLVVGVNGTGKTTTIGKLSALFRRSGKSVMLAAGDTFRAAAIDQLKIWGERTDAPVIASAVGSDAASLAYSALQAAQAQARDVLLLDTAGRLQNKAALMEELEKVVRVLRKLDATAPHDVVLVLDATTGQNALAQVEVFKARAGVTGLVMTKLDGTARGGILVAIAAKHALPVHAIGVGEGVDDFQPFSAKEFARAIAGG